MYPRVAFIFKISSYLMSQLSTAVLSFSPGLQYSKYDHVCTVEES